MSRKVSKSNEFKTVDVDGLPIQFGVVNIDKEWAETHLANNGTNRPFKAAHVNRLAEQILQGEWHFIGESLVIDNTGQIADGQHRLQAVVLAETRRQVNPAMWPAWHDEDGNPIPVSLPTAVVIGVNPDYCDCFDTGIVRSGRDVVFRIREELFGTYPNPTTEDGKWSTSDLARMSTILQTAAKCLYSRVVLDKLPRATSAKFAHGELKKILDRFPNLAIAVELVYSTGKLNKTGHNKLNPSYLAAAVTLAFGYAESQESFEELHERIKTALEDAVKLTAQPDSPIVALYRFNTNLTGGKGRADNDLNRLANACVIAVESIVNGIMHIKDADLETADRSGEVSIHRMKGNPIDLIDTKPETWSYTHCGVKENYTLEQYIHRFGCSPDAPNVALDGYEEVYQKGIDEEAAYAELTSGPVA